MFESVERTSDTRCVRGVKIAAKAVGVTGFGKGAVTEMGRCSEKKDEAAMSGDELALSAPLVIGEDSK